MIYSQVRNFIHKQIKPKPMKKILSFVIALFTVITIQAQGFENVHMMPSFEKEAQSVTNTNLTGKKISYTDYPASDSTIDVKEMSKADGITLALMLVQDLKKLQLNNGIPNLFFTYEGIVIVWFSDKNKRWELMYTTKTVSHAYKGCRIFRLS